MAELASMPKYEAYKESGFEWIGEVPDSWELTKLGSCLFPVSIKNCPDLPLLSITRELGVIERDIENQDSNHNFIPDDLSGYKKLEKGQFGMNKMKAWQGSYGVSQYTGIVSPAYFVFNFTKSINPEFFNWAIRSKLYVSYFGSASDGVRVGQWDLSKDRMKAIPFILPSEKEQTAIANFLDIKTAQIDEAIAIKEKQIELLKERKQIIIQQAVTQGLNPNAPMKDSGVDWIGEIPEHWAYEPIKHSLKGIIDCEHKTAPFVDETDYFVVRTTNVKGGKLQMAGAKYTHEKGFTEWTRRGVPKVGDVLLTREAPAGEACLVPDNVKLCLGQRMVWLKIDRERLIPEFAISLIYSSIGRTYIDFLSSGSTVLHFNMADINNIPVVLPPLKEQQELVEFIRNESGKVDDGIEIQIQQIEKLKEYKTTLINSAVTGKIKVPELMADR
ncbi:restriction endonuclease subunit S [Psychromonas aquatilis]|uniref:Restriction endonuclease subunit S n=1 Tax=Psychromonas aquatilis TaxID=2005072 RepID=A0ABU9GMA4_9GAMM